VAEGIESYVDIGLHPFNHEPRVTPRTSIPEEGVSLGERGCPAPQRWGSGGVTPENFWNLRRNLVHHLSGAFWLEIDGSAVFHLCERKHCHSAIMTRGRPTAAKQVLPLRGSWWSFSRGEYKFVSGGVLHPYGWLDKPLYTSNNLLWAYDEPFWSLSATSLKSHDVA